MIKLLLGLGNPEERFVFSRHNLGYTLVELLARKKRVKFRSGRGEYIFARAKIKKREIILVKPQIFMNESGIAAKECLHDFKLDVEELLVLCDDINLSLGKIRVKPGGSDGGHNGLKSIIYHLGSEDFARLRMGVGLPSSENKIEDYVLDGFQCQEEEEAKKMLKQAGIAVETIISLGIAQSMNRFN